MTYIERVAAAQAVERSVAELSPPAQLALQCELVRAGVLVALVDMTFASNPRVFDTGPRR